MEGGRSVVETMIEVVVVAVGEDVAAPVAVAVVGLRQEVAHQHTLVQPLRRQVCEPRSEVSRVRL